MPLDQADLKARVAQRLAQLTTEIVDVVVQNVTNAGFAESEPSGEFAERIEFELVAALAEMGSRVTVEKVREWLRATQPSLPNIDDLSVAGYAREQDYVWARTATPIPEMRGPNGLLKEWALIRILGGRWRMFAVGYAAEVYRREEIGRQKWLAELREREAHAS